MKSILRPDPETILTGQNVDRLLNFYGVVKDNNDSPIEGAVVMAFACFAGGVEKFLGSALTDRGGRYFISIPKLTNYNGLLGFKVRAGKEANLLSEGVDSPENLTEHSHPNEEFAMAEKEIYNENITGVLTEHFSDDLIQEGETNENKKSKVSPFKKAITKEFTYGWKEKCLTACAIGTALLTLTMKKR
jgi:hypothetical protein